MCLGAHVREFVVWLVARIPTFHRCIYLSILIWLLDAVLDFELLLLLIDVGHVVVRFAFLLLHRDLPLVTVSLSDAISCAIPHLLSFLN